MAGALRVRARTGKVVLTYGCDVLHCSSLLVPSRSEYLLSPTTVTGLASSLHKIHLCYLLARVCTFWAQVKNLAPRGAVSKQGQCRCQTSSASAGQLSKACPASKLTELQLQSMLATCCSEPLVTVCLPEQALEY
jgi:hypothetical protein